MLKESVNIVELRMMVLPIQSIPATAITIAGSIHMTMTTKSDPLTATTITITVLITEKIPVRL